MAPFLTVTAVEFRDDFLTSPLYVKFLSRPLNFLFVKLLLRYICHAEIGISIVFILFYIIFPCDEVILEMHIL